MSSLPAISDEDGAIARLQEIFPGLDDARLYAVLDSCGCSTWDARVCWAFEHLMDEGETCDVAAAMSRGFWHMTAQPGSR